MIMAMENRKTSHSRPPMTSTRRYNESYRNDADDDILDFDDDDILGFDDVSDDYTYQPKNTKPVSKSSTSIEGYLAAIVEKLDEIKELLSTKTGATGYTAADFDDGLDDIDEGLNSQGYQQTPSQAPQGGMLEDIRSHLASQPMMMQAPYASMQQAPPSMTPMPGPAPQMSGQGMVYDVTSAGMQVPMAGPAASGMVQMSQSSGMIDMSAIPENNNFVSSSCSFSSDFYDDDF